MKAMAASMKVIAKLACVPVAFIGGGLVGLCIFAVIVAASSMWRWALRSSPEFESLESRITALEAAQEKK